VRDHPSQTVRPKQAFSAAVCQEPGAGAPASEVLALCRVRQPAWVGKHQRGQSDMLGRHHGERVPAGADHGLVKTSSVAPPPSSVKTTVVSAAQQLLAGRVRAGQQQVVGQWAGEHVDLLGDQRDPTGWPARRPARPSRAADTARCPGWAGAPGDELGQGASCRTPLRPNKGDPLPAPVRCRRAARPAAG